MNKLEYASKEWLKLKTSDKVKWLRESYGDCNSPCWGTLEDMIFEEIYEEVKKLESSLASKKETET